MKKKLLILGLVFAVLIFRLWLTDKGWHVDMLSNAGWGEWIYNHGPAKFYDNSYWTYSWPTQPPLINSVYAFNKNIYIETLGRLAWAEFQIKKVTHTPRVLWLTGFVQWFGYGKINNEIPFQIGYLVTMKFFPILADILIGTIIYIISGKKLKWALIYLISPFSWYLSALWGQYDGVGFLLAFLGFLSIGGSFSILGPGLITLAILIKPTSLILLPFFLYLFFRKKANLIGLLLPLFIFWVTTKPYTYKNPFEFARYDLMRIVFEKAEPRISVNAFNFWRIFIGDAAKRDNLRYLSLMVFGMVNVWGIYLSEKQKLSVKAMWESLFVISMGAFLLMTGMLDRYAFTGIGFGLMAVTNYPKLFKYWLFLSLIFWANLYYHWWYPPFLAPLKNTLLWHNGAVTRLLSAVNVFLFLLISVSFAGKPKLKPVNFQKAPDHPIRKPKAAAGI